MIDDLVTWLRQQLTHLQQIAATCGAQDWRYPHHGVIVDRDVDGWANAPDDARIFGFVDPDRSDEALHAVHHDPAQVRRDIDADLLLLDTYDRAAAHRAGEVLSGLATAIKIRAVPHDHRPGYREEWRPA
ncbi:DUF6221 family protein [Micromonospora carbonacea]|uniref:Uncharacterized protein n=1 Tax=Micromonospora carbonacea TaxID=47853 RepID=A0A1C4WYG2_9ACTN|nr:DUF6221 family protein [Micromonospora carbonacea]SCF01239.1 hypothetical protein GA0070563_104112 [Micromonospora carbonacea]